MGETADTSVNCIFFACKALHFILNRHSIHHKHVLQRWIMLLFRACHWRSVFYDFMDGDGACTGCIVIVPLVLGWHLNEDGVAHAEAPTSKVRKFG